jgi:fluoroacetyl-CoA thioesterase
VAIDPGLSGTAVLRVGEPDLAVAFGSGSVPVLATPRLVALCEEATMKALTGQLPPGHTTVGMRVQLDHLAPTASGGQVTAEAVLKKVEGRRLTFEVSTSDERGLIGAGKVTRVLVETDRFMERTL